MMFKRDRKGMIGPVLAALLPLFLVAFLPMKAGAVTLGDALEFSALSTDGNVSINNVAKVGIAPIGPQGDVGGDSVVLGNNSLAGGNVDADPGDITLGNFSKVNGECITDGGSITKGIGAKCHTESTAGDGGLKAQAITDVGTFVTALLAATPTETLPALTVKNFPGTTLPLAAGLNIIEIPSVTLNNSSTLTLNGEGLGGTVVLEIDGTLKIGSGSKIVLAGGLTAADVVIYVGGSIATWGNTTTINGTVLVPNAAVSAGSGAKVFGAIIAGDDVTFLENAGLTFDPTLVDIPSNVPPPPLTLGDAAPFLLVSTDGNTKLGNVTLANPAAPNAGEIGGISDTFGSNSVIQGNVIALEGGPDITLGNFTKVKSTCYTNGGTVSLGSGASCASTDATVNAPPVLGLIGAGPDASSFEAGAASFPVDQFLAAIKIAAGKTQTISTGPNPVTVFDTPSITLGGSATLKIVGTAGQIAVINVTGGALTLGPGFTIALSGGITADSVVFNVESTSPTPALIGGTSSTFNGTLVASARACQVNTGAAINGQIVCGGDVTVGDNLTAAYVPLVPIPFP